MDDWRRVKFMALVTLQVVDGFERGRVFSELPTPVTIGREEDNSIQLNDERVSRFHAKIQEEAGRVILTDLESTNGTRVNGRSVQMRVLQVGDHLAVGRSLLLFGSTAEIAARSNRPDESAPPANLDNLTVALPGGRGGPQAPVQPGPAVPASLDGDFAALFPHGAPELPSELRAIQAAQLSDLLAYIHDRIREVVDHAVEEPVGKGVAMHIDWNAWQQMLKLEMELAIYMRRIADPNH